jgi:hypothetical protein
MSKVKPCDVNFGRFKKMRPKHCAIFSAKNAQQYVSLKRRNFAQSWVDVMITIFCDFREFSAKNGRFSAKPVL